MRYTVVWLQDALAQLAQIWLEASDRKEITTAADRIDQELAIDPSTKGTTVSEELRSLYVPPLCAVFSVSEPDRLVEVASIRLDVRFLSISDGNGQAQ